jgi:hypothetical protein
LPCRWQICELRNLLPTISSSRPISENYHESKSKDKRRREKEEKRAKGEKNGIETQKFRREKEENAEENRTTE